MEVTIIGTEKITNFKVEQGNFVFNGNIRTYADTSRYNFDMSVHVKNGDASAGMEEHIGHINCYHPSSENAGENVSKNINIKNEYYDDVYALIPAVEEAVLSEVID